MEFESKGFCAVLKNGSTESKEGKVTAAFEPMAKGASVAWVDFVIENEKEAAKIASSFGFSDSLISKIAKAKKSGYEDLESELALLIPAISVEGTKVSLLPLTIFMNHNTILTLHPVEARRFFRLRRYAKTYLEKISSHIQPLDRMTLLLARILGENNTRNFEYLHLIEEQGDTLSRDLSNSHIARDKIGKDIYRTKHALITYLSGLWAVQDTLNSLRYSDAKLISDNPKMISRLSRLVFEVHSQIGLAEHLSEVLSSGLEVLQSIYNNQLQILNNRLAMLVAYLTIIGTAVLVPNTIATVMSSSAFNLTVADEGWYIALIVGSTILATAFSFLFVERMGLLPKRPDKA